MERAADCFRGIESSGIYYASLQAVNALYSRVYLYMEDWNNALKYAKLAIGTGQLSQGDTYLNMYQDLSTTGEAIFRLNGIDQSGKLKAFMMLPVFLQIHYLRCSMKGYPSWLT